MLEVQLEEKEWVKLNFLISYNNKWIQFFIGIGMLQLWLLIDYAIWNSFGLQTLPSMPLIMSLLVFIGMPLSIYRNSKKAFKSNPQLNQKGSYILDSHSIQISGDSFKVVLQWKEVYEIKELKEWFVIFSAKNRGFFIPKRIFDSVHETDEFREKLSLLSVAGIRLRGS